MDESHTKKIMSGRRQTQNMMYMILKQYIKEGKTKLQC